MQTTTNPVDMEKALALAAEIGERPIKATSDNRGLIRRWLTAMGAAYSAIANLPLAELANLYNDADALFSFLTRSAKSPEVAPVFGPYSQPTPEPTQTVARAPKTNGTRTPQANGAPAAALADAIAAMIAAGAPPAAEMDEERVIDLIKQHAPTPEPREWKITVAAREPVVIPRQHFKFPLLMATIAARVPAYLVGPAGTGKTTAASVAAHTLGLPYGAISVGPMTSKSDLFGMRDAHGKYHPSELVTRATQGGVFLFDEFDAGNPSTLTAVNMLLANGEFSTPEGMQKKHADFVPIFALNTYGTGASREYVGRNQLDAATLDRGAFIDWPLDEGLEAAFIGIDMTSPEFILSLGGIPTPGDWLKKVQSTRHAVARAGIRHIISPRATLYGAALAAAGVGQRALESILLRKGLDDTAAEKIGLSIQ